MAISSKSRQKMLEINRLKTQESMERTDNTKSAVDRALDELEKESKETEPVPATDRTDTSVISASKNDGEPTNSGETEDNMSIHLKRGNYRNTKNFSKSVRLTEKAVENMNRVAREYNISANELINQLLEQL